MIYYEVEFDEDGFLAPGREATRIYWRDVVRVAYCMEIDSGALEVDDYWAFQTTDPGLITWVQMNPSNDFIRRSFSAEVRRRFGVTDIPPGHTWRGPRKSHNVYTYVIYPEADAGKSLYISERESWWPPKLKLKHALD